MLQVPDYIFHFVKLDEIAECFLFKVESTFKELFTMIFCINRDR